MVEKALYAIATVPEKELLIRFRLGTHLLQRLTQNKSSEYMEVLPAPYFYPLGPEISRHWFYPHEKKNSSGFTYSNTYVIHWYHSVEKKFLNQELTPILLEQHKNWPITKWL
jgi:hypothetical protein